MKTRISIQIALVMLMVVSLACSLGLPQTTLKTGPTEIMTLNEPILEPDASVDLSLSIAIGDLHLAGGADGLLEGVVRYNVADWKPTVTRTEGSLSVTQSESDEMIRRFPGDDVVNDWVLKLGDVPMNLTLDAAAYDAVMDLSGLPLRELRIQDGASQSEVRFDVLNPVEMRSFLYRTGASEIQFHSLANANFGRMTFDGGAGEYSFDFSGDLQQDAIVKINVGLSTVTILVPTGTSARVLAGSAAGEVQLSGTWQREAGDYVNPGSGSQLTIVVEMGVGELRLMNP